jgi:hypothetical protein
MNGSPNKTDTFRTRVRSHTIAKAAAVQKMAHDPPAQRIFHKRTRMAIDASLFVENLSQSAGFSILHAALRTQRPLQAILGELALGVERMTAVRVLRRA